MNRLQVFIYFDVARLLDVFAVADAGNTLVVIEHNLDVIER